MNFRAKAPKIAPRILCIGMPVRERRRQVSSGVAGPITQAIRPLHVAPAEAGVTATPREDVELLPAALTDVADVDVAGRTVDAEAPRVAQSDGMDLGPRVRIVCETVVWGDRVRRGGVDVEAQELSQE